MTRVFNRYLLGDFIKNFLITLGVLTFVMYVGAVVQAIDYMSRGISGLLILKIFALNIPFTLSFVIPMSVLTTVLLHFGRLSADGEITAMKSCGISLWQTAAPIVFCAVLLSAVCLYLNAELSPRSHFARRQMLRDLGEEDPLALLEEGRFANDFPGVKVYVGKKADRQLEDIILYQFDDKGARAEVRAKSGTVDFNPETRVMEIDLRQVRLTEYDPDHPDDQTKARTLSADSYPITLDLRQMLRKGKINKKPSDMTFAELVRSIQNVRQTFPDIQEANVPRLRTKMAVDANKRLALAMSCFSFTLLAIPLGIRSHRKESSLGIALALVLMFTFYLFIIIADALVERPEWRPDMIPWIPVLGSQLLGCLLLFRNR
ncbi:MAG: YjgP/YjgQ family permease [Spartobacteria bacterium]|nr:YjgP/YjgQ family permease [Spartobacteria bacterium]